MMSLYSISCVPQLLMMSTLLPFHLRVYRYHSVNEGQVSLWHYIKWAVRLGLAGFGGRIELACMKSANISQSNISTMTCFSLMTCPEVQGAEWRAE